MLKTFALTLLVATCSAFVQELTLYSGLSCTGPAITFQSKEANLANYEFFLPSIQSRRFHGWWFLYTGANFTPYQTSTGYSSTSSCANTTAATFAKSLRFLGPLETDTLVLAVYDGANAVGTELIITAPAATNFGFVADYAVASSHSSWTLYTNADFTGPAVCLAGGGGLTGRSFVFRSVTSGCNKSYKIRGTKNYTQDSNNSSFNYF